MDRLKKFKPRYTVLVVAFVITQCCCCIFPITYSARRTLSVNEIVAQVNETLFSVRESVQLFE